jgi:predicted permease
LLASGIRLLAAPLIALALALALGVSGLTRQVSIVQSAMPTAVFSGVLATEFGNDSDFVTAVILVSTLLSILTLSVLLSLLM